MKKRIVSLLLCVCLALSLLPGMAFAAGGQYGDVAGHWAENAISRWSEYGIVQGSNGQFRPDAFLTRGEMAAILANTLGLTDEGAENPFRDVAPSDWFAPYVLRCYAAGIMKGDGASARPNATITRQEAMVMLCRALAIPEKAGANLSAYGDGANVADWAKGAVAAMTEANIVGGVGGNRLAPAADINRASVVTILDRAVVQYIRTPGAHTLTEQDGIVLVAADGDVTLTGTTAADILVTPAGKGRTLTFDKATVTGAITVQADNMRVTGTDSTLPGVVTTGKNITLENVKPASTGNTGSTGGGSGSSGGGGGGGTRPSAKGSVSLRTDKTVSGTTVPVGAVLTATISNPNSATVVWLIGGVETAVQGDSYTVTASDLGKEIQVKLVKDGEDEAVSGKFTVESSTTTTVDSLKDADADAPVKLAANTTFKDSEGQDVTVASDAQLVLSVEPKTVSAAEKAATQDEVSTQMTNSLTVAITGNDGGKLSDEQQEAVTAALAATDVKAVDVDLTLVKTEGGETTETAVHPVGETRVTLSAAQLGMAGEDLNLYHFVANHTNANEEKQSIPGVVNAEGTAVTFITNGLSTIWIGNVPPRRVTFDTGAGGTVVESQMVKFGNRVNTSKLPEKIERSGYVFCGWNYDLAVTPIIENMTITAVWVEGNQVPENRITAELSATDSNIALTTEAGKVTAAANKDAESLTANLKVNLSVANLTGAAKYGVSQSAQVAAAIAAKDMTDVSGSAVTLDPVTVTDGNGKVDAHKTSYYIKWVAENGNVLALEEVVVVVDDGQGAADSKTVTRNVNRGLGRFEPYMISSTKGDAPTWVGYINGHIQKSYMENASYDYDLDFSVGFNEHFESYNEETGELEYQYEPKDYDTLTLEFTPFSGESFASKTISAKFEHYEVDDWTELTTTMTQKEDGKLTITLDTKTVNVPVTRRWIDDLNLHLTVDGVESRIYLGGVPNPNYAGETNRDYELVKFTDMASLKDAISNASAAADKEWNLRYNGAEQQFTITESIDIPVNCRIAFDRTANNAIVSAAVPSGVTVTMHSAEDEASHISCEGAFTVGGKIAAITSDYDGYGGQLFAEIYCDQITVQSGSVIEVRNTPFMLRGRSNRNAVCTLEADSTATVTSGVFNMQNFKTATLNGQVDVNSEARLYLHNDSNVVGGTIGVNSNYWNGTEFYGTTTIESTGKVNASGTSRGYAVEFNGPLDNKGSVTISGDVRVIVSNKGYASQSSGAIEVNGTLDLSGTKLVNTGRITGSGTITGAVGEDTTSYDENNGLEYVRVSGDQTPDNYSRYKFTKDPDATVDVTLFKASLVNEGGTCSITPTFEDFPEN